MDLHAVAVKCCAAQHEEVHDNMKCVFLYLFIE